MNDLYKNHAVGMSDPVLSASTITPDDAADLPTATRAVYIGVAGNLHVTLISGDIVTFQNMNQGWHPLRVARVWAAGTTASGVVGCS